MLTKTISNITGYSKTIEKGDVIVFDRQLEERPFKVTDVIKRNYNGVFENPEDSIDTHFDASVIKIEDDEVRELRKNVEFSLTIAKY